MLAALDGTSAAKRREERRLRAPWRTSSQSGAMAVPAALYHSADGQMLMKTVTEQWNAARPRQTTVMAQKKRRCGGGLDHLPGGKHRRRCASATCVGRGLSFCRRSHAAGRGSRRGPDHSRAHGAHLLRGASAAEFGGTRGSCPVRTKGALSRVHR